MDRHSRGDPVQGLEMATIQEVISDTVKQVNSSLCMVYLLIAANRLRTRDVRSLSRVLREAADRLDSSLGTQGTIRSE